MQNRNRWIVAAAIVLSACRPSAARRSGEGSAAPLMAERSAAHGKRVYRGNVFDLSDPASDTPVFRYERRVHPLADAMASVHTTVDSAGEEVVVHAATHGRDYTLREFSAVQSQLGITGVVRVAEDGSARFERTKKGSTIERRESAGPPIVVGPTLFGFTLRHWERLQSGHSIEVRFAVIERARTYRFDLMLESSTPQFTAFTMTAIRPLIRKAIGPIRMVFDTGSREIVRYEGRVPPLVQQGRRLRPLNGRVEYILGPDGYR